MFVIEQQAGYCSESGCAMTAKKNDRRVQRTQQLLRSALHSLIQEKGFEALTVQDIIDRANVGRATFYAHFDNKEDLLVSGLDVLRASLRERQRQRQGSLRSTGSDEHLFAFSDEVFLHAGEHREMFRHMLGKRSGAVIQQLFHKMLVELVRDDVTTLVSRSPGASLPAEAVVQFVAGGLFGLLMWWVDGRMRLSPEEVNSMFRRLALPAVKAALR